MIKLLRPGFSVGIALLALLAPPALAAPPQTINYQGFLADAGGTPVTGTVGITFRLYNAASGGTALYTEVQPSIAVTTGIFNAMIGSTTPITLPFDVPYWLTVAVNADPEMSPRQPLASSPYAFRAAALDSGATLAGSQLTGSITTATIPVANVVGAVPGPPGPPGPTSVANCPGGMTRIELPHSTLCYHEGNSTLSDWDTADGYCFDQFQTGMCTLNQWRAAICRAGAGDPGRSWLADVAGRAADGTPAFATISGCTGESVGESSYPTALRGPCCQEWPRY